MDPSSNFYNYRTALRGATQRSITANSSREKVMMTMINTKDLVTHVCSLFIALKPRKTPILYQVESTLEFNLAKVNMS